MIEYKIIDCNGKEVVDGILSSEMYKHGELVRVASRVPNYQCYYPWWRRLLGCKRILKPIWN